MTELVIGIDPGKATGVAWYDLDTCKVVKVLETPRGIDGFQTQMRHTLHNEVVVDLAHCACERFDLRSSNEFVANLQGVEVIGWLKGEGYVHGWPMPVQHMQLTRLRKNVDKYQDSKITHLMKEAGFLIGEGHTRMALSVAVWYAAMILKHKPTMRMLTARP